jgi:HK97 family phage major capsid protein
MKWSNFVEQITSAGFEGASDDFAAVVKWLKAEGHDTETVTTDDGEDIVLQKLYEDRPGKKLNVSKANEQAKFQEAVKAEVDARVSDLEASLKPRNKGKADKKHDIKVGKDRLADDPKGGFKHAGEFYKAVMLAGSGGESTPDELVSYQKATLSTYGREDVGADGGFAVPQEYREAIMQIVNGEDSILSRCTQIPLSGNSVSLVTDETTPWQTSGGILAYWGGEAGTLSQTKPNLKGKELKLRKVYALVPVTDELLEDSTALGAWLPRKAGEKLDFKVGEAIFRGTGAGQPLGFLNSGSLISVTKESSQVANTFMGANAIKMWQRLYAPWRRNAVWFANQDCEYEFRRMQVAGSSPSGDPVTGDGLHVYMPSGGISGQQYDTLFGRPVIYTQHAMELGSVGDVSLCAMDKYLCAIKSGGIESSSSIHLWFDQDTTAFKFRLRVDGQPEMDTTISPRAGSNTMSAFVVTAER